MYPLKYVEHQFLVDAPLFMALRTLLRSLPGPGGHLLFPAPDAHHDADNYRRRDDDTEQGLDDDGSGVSACYAPYS
jgi:hypothetical protein